jgi:sporulation protein YlmC with PRC-barrel domain
MIMQRVIMALAATLALIGSAAGQTPAQTSEKTSADNSQFLNVPRESELSSNLVGLDVYNNNGDELGTIKDVAIGSNGQIDGYILSVGGVLGIGEHFVAVKPAAVTIKYNTGDKKWHAAMNVSKDQLKSASAFKYEGRWNASKS